MKKANSDPPPVVSTNAAKPASRPCSAEGPYTINEILAAELGRLRPKQKIGDPNAVPITTTFDDLHEADLTALCLSGGGIRSATFALGILQSLADNGLLGQLDYLSTVSGGGYIGSWLSAWIRVEHVLGLETEAKEAFAERHEEPTKRKHQLDTNGFPSDVENFVLRYVQERLFESTDLTSDGVEAVQKLLKEGRWPSTYRIECNASAVETSSKVDKKIVLETPPDEDAGSLLEEATVQPPDPTVAAVSAGERLQQSNPEPRPVRHLREYSNYMTPKVGIFSADTWTLFGIYLRNLFLNWTIYIPLLAAILLIPAFLRSLLIYLGDRWDKPPNAWLLYIALAAGAVALAYGASHLPSKDIRPFRSAFSDDTWVIVLGVLPLLVMAYCASAYWWNLTVYGHPPDGPQLAILAVPRLRDFITYPLYVFGAGYLGFLLITLSRVRSKKQGRIRTMFRAMNVRGVIFGLAASVVGGCLLAIIALNILPITSELTKWFATQDGRDVYLYDDYKRTIFLCIAVPVLLGTNLIQSAIFIGLASRETTDDDREWMARYGGWILLAGLLWFVSSVGVLFAGSVVQYAEGQSRVLAGRWSITWGTLVTLISGAISLIGGFSSKFPVRKNPDGSRKLRFVSAIPQVASGIFLAILLILISTAASTSVVFVAHRYFESWGEWAWLCTPQAGGCGEEIVDVSPWLIAASGLGLAAVGFVMGLFVNVNRFSLHGAYRDRLVRAYLGASNPKRRPNAFTGFDEHDNRQLHRLKRQKPLHVINATLNLVASENLAWQNRKATAFTMTPLHCGSEVLGYRHSNEYSRFAKAPLGPCRHLRFCNQNEKPCVSASEKDCKYPGKSLRLGTAMAVSGAAADPNMGYYSSALVTFVMSLFNIRLGWWLGNTGCKGSEGSWNGSRVMHGIGKLFGIEVKEFYKRADPTLAVWPLINETFGRTSEERRYLNITDGGHFENLALYEMVRRRCRLIIVSDAAADQGFTFGELSNALEKCRVDLGVRIDVPNELHIYSRDEDAQLRLKGKRFFLAEIRYPERAGDSKREKSWLLYCRPTLRGTEPVDIQHYASANDAFPHQSTGDQFFDERQFEAYRKLGRITFDEIISESAVRSVMNSVGLVVPDQTVANP